MGKVDCRTAFTYWFAHFAVEVICFFSLETLFGDIGAARWVAFIFFDTLAFATQPVIGSFCEEHAGFRPGVTGAVMLIIGAAFSLTLKDNFLLSLAGLIIFTLGNALVHISGALATARSSEGKLSESAIFVGGGSFGVITGRMLASAGVPGIVAFIPIIIALPLMYLADVRLKKLYGDNCFDFTVNPVKHNIANDRPAWAVIIILGLIVVARGYIGYGLPTGWRTLSVHTVLLFVFMGTGKMLGGILSDIFGARRTGIISCLLALPVLLVSNNIMWLSLIGISLFSMTMAVTLGGLFSVMRKNPGTAFGVTTIGLLLGSLPLFFIRMPSQFVCNILNIVMSVFASIGFIYCVNNNRDKRKE